MILNVYSIRDTKTEAYHKPFFLQNDEVAIRAISSSLHEMSELSQHAQDYVLYNLGEFDDNSGRIEPLDTPRHVANIDVIQRENINIALKNDNNAQNS